MAIYNINIQRLALMLLPHTLRKKTLTNLLWCALVPLVQLQYYFERYRREKHQHLTRTPQVTSLLYTLAEEFDILNADDTVNITAFAITDTPPIGVWQIVYSETHDNISDSSRIVLQSNESSNTTSIGIINPVLNSKESTLYNIGMFTVHCPSELYNNADQLLRIKSIVNTYRLIGTNPTYQSK